jgi:ferrous iron transport protein B
MPVVALVGNPNSGKSSLFNALTGFRQKIGNYPGVTVDIKSGHLQVANLEEVTLVDMPGLYNLYPATEDG